MMNELSREDSLIEQIATGFALGTPGVVMGIGDDCSVVEMHGVAQLTTTDMLIEGIHFNLKEISPATLAYRTLQVNLSDIAAMGGVPEYFWLNVALPKHIEQDWLDEFITTITNIAIEEGIELLGGDTTASSNGLMISVTLQGAMSVSKVKYRHDAKPIDTICVTGTLGDSRAGFDCLSNPPEISEEDKQALIQAHQKPVAQLHQGEFFASQSSVHAMMDVSDGLMLDLERLCRQSDCGAHILLDRLPISTPLKNFCKATKSNPQEYAALGGEDYCLLVTVAAKDFDDLSKAYETNFKTPLLAIGTITSQNSIDFTLDGSPYTFKLKPFQHFG